MNFVEKFSPSATAAAADGGIHSPIKGIVVSAAQAWGSQSGAVIVDDAHLLFSGHYERSGTDLTISDQDREVVIHDYFRGDKRPTLVSPDGAPLDPKVIAALTGHVAYAQADGSVSAAKVIGHVVKITGSASIVRNGVAIILNTGDNINQGDVAQTGSNSTLGLVLIDGTTFNMNANARLMLNDLVYDPNGTSNSSLITLVQGAASFVAGQVAKTGDMKVATPVATMGIRGTAVILDINATDGKVSISVVDQQDNQIHAVQVYDRNGNLIGTVTSNGSALTLTPTANFEVIAQETNKTVAQVAQEFTIFQQVLSTYDLGKQLIPNTPPPSDGKRGDANPQSTTKFANLGSTPIAPSDTPVTTLLDTNKSASATGGSQPLTVTQTATPAVAVTQNQLGGPSQTIIVTTTPDTTVAQTPFVVTPSPIIQVSSGAGNHFGPVISADGRFVTYDPDGAIYLYDRASNTTVTLASPAAGFTYGSPTISSDGRFVIYQGTNGSQTLLFVYDNDPSDPNYKHITQLAAGSAPAVSGDGSVIVAENGTGGIVVYDQSAHVVATITAAALGSSGTVWKPAISADGHIIAFWASPTGAAGGAGQLFTYNVSTGSLTTVASTIAGAGTSAASLSADGHYVVFQSVASGGHSEISLYDLVSKTVVFHTANAEASYNPVISPDGHFIIFASAAKLTADDTNKVADTYVVDVTDLSHPSYKLISVLADGTAGNAASDLGGAISAGGLFVAFGSSASNFSVDDTNGAADIFLGDPSSGRSVIINETAASPAILTASGVIALTGAVSGAQVTVTQGDHGTVTATIGTDGNIHWTYQGARSDFAFLQPGQVATQNVVLNLSSSATTTAIPLKISIFDADQPAVVHADVAPVATPVTLAQGQEGTAYTISAATLLAGVTDIDGPSLAITGLGIHSGGGTLADNHNGTFTYTPAANYNGPVVFDYTASDGTLTSSSIASLSIIAVTDSIPVVSATSNSFVESAGTGNPGTVSVSGTIGFTDADMSDRPSVSAAFTSFTYSDAQHHDITSALTPAQVTDVAGIETLLVLTPAAGNTNDGSAIWTYSIADNKLDFLAADETLTLTYAATVDDGRGGVATTPLTINITGSNDAPIVAAGTMATGTINIPVETAPTNTVSPGLAAQLGTSGLISSIGTTTGYGSVALPAGDDNSSGAIDITSVFGSAGLDFFGTHYTSLYVNNNGNITFASPSGVFTPTQINAGFNNPIIAAFWADVDTRGTGAVYVALDPADGVMTITWDHVGYFSEGTDKLDSFQIVLINEGNGDFDISYRYGDIGWTTGSASGGSGGLGGTPARAGYSAGDVTHYFELPQSGDQAALLALNTTAGNTGIAGIDEFQVRAGTVAAPTQTASGTIAFADVDLSDRPSVSAAFSSYAVTDAGGPIPGLASPASR